MAPPTGPIGLGVLGAADIALRRTLPALERCEGLRLAAVASRSLEKARACTARFGGDPVPGYEALLERTDVQAVYIPLPNSLHVPWAERALHAGKHVLVEKSLTADGDEAARLARLAEDRGLVLMENFAFLHHAQHTRLRELIAEGVIGTPRSFSASFGIPAGDPALIRYSRELGGGALRENGCYPIRAAQLLLGENLRVLGATLHRDPATGVDVAGSVLLGDGAGISALCDFGLSHAYRNTYAVWGSAGRIEVDWAFTPTPEARTVLRLTRAEGSREWKLPPCDQFLGLLTEFAEACAQPAARRDHAAAAVRQARLLEQVETAAADTPAHGGTSEPRRHVLWIGFPAFGHLKATLGMVEELRRRGHRVSYLAAERFADRVAQTGARVVAYPSRFPESITAAETATTMAVEFLRESFAPLEAALALAAQDAPDLVVHDALAADTAAAVSRRYGVPTVRLYPGFGTNEQVPLNGTEPGADHEPFDPADPRLTELAAELTARVEAAGVREELGGGVASGDDAAVNISFVVREFQPKGETFDDGYLFAGPCLRETDFAGRWSPPPGAAPIVLITLGTSVNRDPEFFRTCIETFAKTPWHVVMTLGGGVDPADLGPLPPNVEAHAWIPHLAVLEHASVFVCQGGTGSLMEAFHWGVPVVVVPRQWDQHAIAQQVVDLGVGLKISPEDLDAQSLRDTVEAVAADPRIAGRARVLGRAVRGAPGAAAVADRMRQIMDGGG